MNIWDRGKRKRREEREREKERERQNAILKSWDIRDI